MKRRKNTSTPSINPLASEGHFLSSAVVSASMVVSVVSVMMLLVEEN